MISSKCWDLFFPYEQLFQSIYFCEENIPKELTLTLNHFNLLLLILVGTCTHYRGQ